MGLNREMRIEVHFVQPGLALGHELKSPCSGGCALSRNGVVWPCLKPCGMSGDHYYSVNTYELTRWGEAKWALADVPREVGLSSPNTHVLFPQAL